MATGKNICTYFEGAWHEGDPHIMRAAIHGSWLGSTVFDGASYVDGIAPDLEAHCARVNRSAETMMIKPTANTEEMVDIVWEGLRLYPKDTAVAAMTLAWRPRDRYVALQRRFVGWRVAMLLKSLRLQDFLSFGRNCMPVELGSLNVVIGANGSGKSNFVEAIDLMRAAPCASESSNAGAIVRDGGGAGEWIWKGAKEDSGACIEAVIDHPGRETGLRYMMRFADDGENRFEIREERVEDAVPSGRRNDPHFFYRRVDGKSLLEENGKHREFENGDIDPGTSILARCKDPARYPEIAWLGEAFGKMRIYTGWIRQDDRNVWRIRPPTSRTIPDAY